MPFVDACEYAHITPSVKSAYDDEFGDDDDKQCGHDKEEDKMKPVTTMKTRKSIKAMRMFTQPKRICRHGRK